MLLAAVAAGDDIGQKQVLIELGLLSEHFAFDMADARQVVRQSRQVGFGSTGQHQRMRDAVDIEVDALIVRHFARVIDQGVITVGALKPVTARKTVRETVTGRVWQDLWIVSVGGQLKKK